MVGSAHPTKLAGTMGAQQRNLPRAYRKPHVEVTATAPPRWVVAATERSALPSRSALGLAGISRQFGGPHRRARRAKPTGAAQPRPATYPASPESATAADKIDRGSAVPVTTRLPHRCQKSWHGNRSESHQPSHSRRNSRPRGRHHPPTRIEPPSPGRRACTLRRASCGWAQFQR